MNSINTALLLALAVNSVWCNDLQIGTQNGRIVLNETVQASPHLLWRQVQKITVNVSDNEVISSIVVNDNRPDKDGYAEIVEGGEGKKNVTIELKSPTVLRGFDFQVTVYAAHEISHPGMSKDIDVNASATPENPANVDDVGDKDILKSTASKTPLPPVLTGQEPRSLNTEQTADPIVQNVTEKTGEHTQYTNDVTKESTDGLKINGAQASPVTPSSEMEVKTTASEETKVSEGLSTNTPQMNYSKMSSTTEDYDFTTENQEVKVLY